MDGALDRAFAACLLGGLGLSVLMVLSGGIVSRLGSRLRLPRVRLGRLRLPGLRGLGRPRAPVAGRMVAPRIAFIPPGTLPVFTGLFATFFGALGLACHAHAGLSPSISVALAAAGSLVSVLLVAFGLWRYLLSGEAESELRGGSPIGMTGRLSLAIPEEGTGTVAYVAQGMRATMPARTRDGQGLPTGTRVIIVDVSRHVAVVESFEG